MVIYWPLLKRDRLGMPLLFASIRLLRKEIAFTAYSLVSRSVSIRVR